MKKSMILLTVIISLAWNGRGQSISGDPEKYSIAFNKNVELLGFAYFIGFEATNIESKAIDIDGEKVLKKDWHNYGYDFFKKFERFQTSAQLQKAFAVADHLWLDYILHLLLQLEDVPNAQLKETIRPGDYIRFSRNNDLDEAKTNVKIFLEGLNAFCREVDFDRYLSESGPYYDKALQEVRESMAPNAYIGHLERYFHKSFASYNLVPSLTLPKGMGFGLGFGQNGIYNVFAAQDWQKLTPPDSLQMGFTNVKKMRELSIHEFGHSFVNPVVAQLPDSLFRTSEVLFKPIEDKMYTQGYNTWKACLYEHYTRAVEILISEQYDSPGSYRRLREEYLEERQFKYIPVILQELHNAQKEGRPFASAVTNSMLSLVQMAREQNDPVCDFTWHTEDVTRFWEVYDRGQGNSKGEIWQKEYLDKGSLGLQAFIPDRIENGNKLARTIKKHRDYYENIRESSGILPGEKSVICAMYNRLDSLYPQAEFPDVYFVVGRRNSGGTAFDKGIIIGIEKFGIATGNFQPDIDKSGLLALIAHEIIHFQQNYPPDNSLLAQAIREGAADFIGELVSGLQIDSESYRYGNAHEAELKTEFKDRMRSNNWEGWLYHNKEASRPKDLGYWMGYQICGSYYSQFSDKRIAISDMLNITDFNSFLNKSKYFSTE